MQARFSFPFLPFTSLRLPPSPLPLLLPSLSFSPLPPLSQKQAPLLPAKIWERYKLPGGVWGRAPVEIYFGAFLPLNLTSGGNIFSDFPENQLPTFHPPKPTRGTWERCNTLLCTYNVQATAHLSPNFIFGHYHIYFLFTPNLKFVASAFPQGREFKI